ncbi:class I SAM-dependent methyltransferase [Pelagibius litoralis]|uniref:class I SAM-dependent methyltransferase n=1 Tax=Pelagibius litoralis TaxID=374515 RepID=UPI00197DD540|nr:methyltransferase domain-containing protein [Pelagibius litoralis]
MRQLVKRVPVLNKFAARAHRWIKLRRAEGRFRHAKNARPLRLVIGSAGLFEPGWIGTDIEYLNLLAPAHWEKNFEKGSIDVILSEHVWEHLTYEDGLEAARRCFEYLRPHGYLRVAVPDGFHPDPDYIASVRPSGSGDGAHDHKVLYNHRTFAAVFEEAGFRVVPLEHFDREGSFHFTEWDPAKGKIRRSKRFDPRNGEGVLNYTSIILDACKDGATGPAV